MKQKFHFNPGYLIFGSIFIYILVILYAYLHTTHLTGYEVTMGSLAVNSSFRGVALRAEEPVSVNASGFINYYAKENEHTSRGGLVYSIDESGVLSEMIEDSRAVNAVLSPDDLQELRSELVGIGMTYEDRRFKDIYGEKESLLGTIRKLANQSALENLQSLSGNSSADLINLGYSPDSGVVSYYTDGLEKLSPADISKETFEESAHTKTQLIDGRLVGPGDPAFNLITDENWSVVIPADEGLVKILEDEEYVLVKFLKNDYESWGRVRLFENEDGTYCELSFTNSMITFAQDRYVDIELLISETIGLKVPNSAIVKREFYLVPEDYKTQGAGGASGFIRRTTLEDGSDSTEFVAADAYNSIDGMLYIDTDVFQAGDVLLKPDSASAYTVRDKDMLTGVYNMNKGYADFTNIQIIAQNQEYAIVSSASQYDLQVYDYIVLDGDGVKDDDFVTNTDVNFSIGAGAQQ
ncbi:MAG: hypothetical protein K6F35_07415 [Lachnospiraceae bacterium]|nr:hypothetical protein [Lachnospiraceae bacterium]